MTGSLKREMTTFGGLLITLSCLSPSIGVFVVGSETFQAVGSGVFLCFLAAVVVGVAMSAVYAEVGSAFPHTGGEYTIAGKVLGPPAGFAILALNIIGLCIALPLTGLSVAEYLKPVFGDVPTVPVAMATVIVVTLLSVLSVKLNAVVTGLFLAVEIAALIATAVLGFSHAHGDVGTLVLHPVTADGAGGLKAAPVIALGVAAAAGIYAFNGYGAVVFFGEEIKNARRSVAAVVYWSLGIAAVTELVPILGIIAGAPDMAKLAASHTPIPDFILQTGGPVMSKVLSLGVAAAIFNTMIAVALVGGRQIYATARDRVWPEGLSRLLDRVHPRFGSPWVATLAMGAAATAGCFIPSKVLVLVLGNGNVALYATLCVAVIVGRRTGSTMQSQAKMPLYPLAPVFVLLCLAGVVWADLLDPKAGLIGLAVTVATLALGAGYYWLALSGRDRWTHHEPIDETNAAE